MFNLKTMATGILLSGALLAAEEMATTPETSGTVIKETKDTVYLITKKNPFCDFKTKCNFKDIGKKMNERRKEGKGIGFGSAMGIMYMDYGPIYDILAKEDDLHGANIKDGYALAPGGHGMVYAGLGNGFRIGLSGVGTQRRFYLDYQGADSANNPADSIATITVNTGIGQLLIEKAWVRDNVNLFAGATIGGGVMMVRKSHSAGSRNSAFASVGEDSSDHHRFDDDFACEDWDRDDGDRAVYSRAWLVNGGIHGGITYTVLPFIHVGMEGDVNVLYSPEGFRDLGDSFTTVNPGARFRLIFGTLG